MPNQYSDETLQFMHGEPQTPEIVAFDASVASTNALTKGAHYLFQCTEDCHVTFAATPTATTSHTLLFAGVPYIFTPSAAYKVAAIKRTNAGNLYMSQLAGYQK